MLTTIRAVLFTMIQLVVPVAIGFWYGRREGAGRDFVAAVSRFVAAVTLPLYFFVRVSRVDLSALLGAGIFPIAAVLHVAIGIACSWIMTRLVWRDLDLGTQRVRIASGGFGNAGYLPLSIHELLPAALPVFGEMLGGPLPPLYIGAYVFFLSPLLWSVGNWLVQGGSGRFEARHLISTPVIGIFAGLTASITGLGKLMETPQTVWYYIALALERLSAVTVPMVLITLGGLIAGLAPSSHNRRALAAVGTTAAVVRLLALPAAFWAVMLLTDGLFGASIPILWVLFLEFHTPTASNLSVMAGRAGRNHDEVGITMITAYGAYIVLFPIYMTLFLMWIGTR